MNLLNILELFVKNGKVRNCDFMKTLKTFFFLLPLFVTSNQVFCQTQQISINGIVTDSLGLGIKNVYIKIRSKKSGAILNYANLLNDTSFAIQLPFLNGDSIVISVNHFSYLPTERIIFSNKKEDSFFVKLIMYPKINDLHDVTVNAPPVWTRGDTTFHKLGAFKQGNERKLKDIILRMPGFEIDDNGNLFYKRKLIEKIMIDGEEVFADKIKLLINNFPIHAVDNVQAIENQNSNPLYKGLKNDYKVFLNLALTKSKIKVAFGTGELGIGSLNRYYINPTFFALHKRVKTAYIGNLNSIGEGMNWREELEQKPLGVLENEKWLMQALNFKTIGNFSNERYITNNRISNNLQINIPYKKSKHTLVLFTLSDKQNQQTFYESSILSDSVYIKRKDTNQITYKPLLVTGKYTWEMKISDSASIKSNISFLYNGSLSHQLSKFMQTGVQNSTENIIQNEFKRVDVDFEYVNRISVNKLFSVQVKFNYDNYLQLGNGISADWASLFNIPTYYNNLKQGIQFNTQGSNIIIEQLSKKKSKNSTFRLLIGWQEYKISNKLAVSSDLNNPKEDTLIKDYSNEGFYSNYTIKMSYWVAIKVGKLPLSINSDFGYLTYCRKENNNTNFYNFPLFNIQVSSNRKQLLKQLFYTNSIKFEQANNPTNQTTNILLPIDIHRYKMNIGGEKLSRNLSVNTSLFYIWPNSSNNSNFQFLYQYDFRNFISTSKLLGVTQIIIDSFINKPTNNISFYTTSTINKLNTNNIFAFGGGFNLQQNLLIINHQFFKRRSDFAYFFIKNNFNFRKKYFITSSIYFFNTKVHLPINDNSINTNFSTLSFLFSQKFALNKRINFTLNTDLYKPNLQSSSTDVLIFSDAQLNIGYPEKNLFFYIKVSNLLNQKNYTNNSNDFLQQSIYQIPIVGRNIFFSVKCEL
jgi:hypothetical protein